jgi:hypothetical protein
MHRDTVHQRAINLGCESAIASGIREKDALFRQSSKRRFSAALPALTQPRNRGVGRRSTACCNVAFLFRVGVNLTLQPLQFLFRGLTRDFPLGLLPVLFHWLYDCFGVGGRRFRLLSLPLASTKQDAGRGYCGQNYNGSAFHQAFPPCKFLEFRSVPVTATLFIPGRHPAHQD